MSWQDSRRSLYIVCFTNRKPQTRGTENPKIARRNIGKFVTKDFAKKHRRRRSEDCPVVRHCFMADLALRMPST